MADETEAVAPLPGLHVRLRAGLRRPHNWVQLLRFVLVGGSGYVVNLAVFALANQVLGLHHLVAATLAFLVAVTNNFWWNRHWTFKAGSGPAAFQAARFLAVSIAAFLVAAGILQLLVTLGMEPLAAQAISIVVATPLNFVGNKMWSFAIRLERD
jgi:putative flippase GtrA